MLLVKPSCRWRSQRIGDAMEWPPKAAVAMEWINLNLEWYRGQIWRNDSNHLEEQRKSCVDPQTLKQEAVKPKLTQGPQDVKDARATGSLPRKTANRKWNQPRRKKFVAVNKDAKGFQDLMTALPSDMEIQSLEFTQMISYLALRIIFDWMNLRRDLELWNINTVEAAADLWELLKLYFTLCYV